MEWPHALPYLSFQNKNLDECDGKGGVVIFECIIRKNHILRDSGPRVSCTVEENTSSSVPRTSPQ